MFANKIHLNLFLPLILVAGTLNAEPAPFSLTKPDGRVASLFIRGTGVDEQVKEFSWDDVKRHLFSPLPNPAKPILAAAWYFQEAVQRMTGKEVTIQEGEGDSEGVVFTLISHASKGIQDDPAVKEALRRSDEDDYNDKEAYFIRSEPKRLLVVANTTEGLLAGAVALLESVGYETLGVGPNWTHVPDYHGKPLTFLLEESGRPGFYIRNIHFTCGQHGGAGTLSMRNMELPDPADENVEISAQRWLVGTRMAGQSMPHFPGHALQLFREKVIAAMREQGTEKGMLVSHATIGADSERPAASEENKYHLWINNDAEGPQAGKFFLSNGTQWAPNAFFERTVDLSVPFVRQMIFDEVKRMAEASFDKNPDDFFVYPTDPADGGGMAEMGQLAAFPNWYPDYLQAEGLSFGRPYKLNGFRGLKQENEIWDPNAPSDTVFGFNNWLLREFDKWIDSLPEAERATSTGKSKKELIRASLYSYNYHDVPPNFNLDPRIRLMVAGYPKHRGTGKWVGYKTNTDIASAFRILLPREPLADYQILSFSRYRDHVPSMIAGRSTLAKAVINDYKPKYDAGFRAFSGEADLNFGKMGLFYYLSSKVLWNPRITSEELDRIRDQWFQRAFGPVWQEMKVYYDFMSPENFKLSSPRNWAKAIRLLDAADRKFDGASEAVRLRLDDLKQFWYFYYLIESGQATPDSMAFKEFMWKGQMSYITPMLTAQIVYFKKGDGYHLVPELAGANFAGGPAHYTHEETQKWWKTILEHWQPIEVTEFADAVLENGRRAAEIDLNDLVTIPAFVGNPMENALSYSGIAHTPIGFLTRAEKAGQEIGFKLFWPTDASQQKNSTAIPYEISYWNSGTREWHDWVDPSMVAQFPQPKTLSNGTVVQWLEVRIPAIHEGIYRIVIGQGGNAVKLTTLDYDEAQGMCSGEFAQTFYTNLRSGTQPDAWFYIPKGTKSLDLECFAPIVQRLTFHEGLPSAALIETRTVDISEVGIHRIPLESGEDGSLVSMRSQGIHFPLLYSVPLLWAKSPASLLVPRAIAEADGLIQAPNAATGKQEKPAVKR